MQIMKHTEIQKLELLWRTSLAENYKDDPKLHAFLTEDDICITLYEDCLSVLLYVKTNADKVYFPANVKDSLKKCFQDITGIEPVKFMVISEEELPF